MVSLLYESSCGGQENFSLKMTSYICHKNFVYPWCDLPLSLKNTSIEFLAAYGFEFLFHYLKIKKNVKALWVYSNEDTIHWTDSYCKNQMNTTTLAECHMNDHLTSKDFLL